MHGPRRRGLRVRLVGARVPDGGRHDRYLVLPVKYKRFAPLAPPSARRRGDPAPYYVPYEDRSSGSREAWHPVTWLWRHTRDDNAAPDQLANTHHVLMAKLGLSDTYAMAIARDAKATAAFWAGLGLVAGTLLGGLAVAALRSSTPDQHNAHPNPKNHP